MLISLADGCPIDPEESGSVRRKLPSSWSRGGRR